ncbi:MAG: hypothetical protein SOZ59_03980 [Candidatus Limivivens sp.]|nr:hypothetical protein [Candidatus Limivivens sp.]
MFYPVHQCLYSGAFCHSGTVGVTVAMAVSGIYVEAAELINEILSPMDLSHAMVIINGSFYRDERVVKSVVIPKTNLILDIRIPEKDLLEFLPPKAYNIVGWCAV